MDKKITITWYIRPENLRIIVVPVPVAISLIALFLLAIVVPTWGLVVSRQELAEANSDLSASRQLVAEFKSARIPSQVNVAVAPSVPAEPQRQDLEPSMIELDSSDREVSDVPVIQPEISQQQQQQDPTSSSSVDLQNLTALATTDGESQLRVSWEIHSKNGSLTTGETWSEGDFQKSDGTIEKISSRKRIPFKARLLTRKGDVLQAPAQVQGRFIAVRVYALEKGLPGQENANTPQATWKTVDLNQ